MKTKIKPQTKFTLKIFFINKETQYISTKKRQRISYFIQIAKESEIEKFYIRVSYGKVTDVFGKSTKAFNDGEYQTKQLLKEAFKCFVEKI